MAAVVASVSLVAACAVGDGSDNPDRGEPAGETWAREADAWIEAYDAAAAAPEGIGPLSVAEFYATDVVFNSSVEEFYGRAEATELDRAQAVSLHRHEFGETYLDATGFLRTEDLSWAASARATVRTWDVSPDGITGMQGYAWLRHAAATDPGFVGVRAARDLATTYVRAWAEADHGTLRTLYWRGASLVDGVYGVEAAGREAIVALADPSTAAPAALQRAADLHAADILARLSSPPDEPAVYLARRFRDPDVRHPARLVLLQRSTSPCPGASATVLTLDEGLIIAERRFHALAALRACAPSRDLREGWWSGRGRPIPLSARVTGRLDLPSGPIEIRNGTPELEEFVLWGLARFDEAGLAPPRVRSIAFDPFSPRCAQFDGYAESRGGAAAILVCEDAGGISRPGRGEDPSCPEPDCPNALPTTRELLVHELAHAWLIGHVQGEARARFMAAVGAYSWNGEGAPYTERGVEVAASAIAWGLGANPRERVGFRVVPCETLADGFRILTGAEPLARCR